MPQKSITSFFNNRKRVGSNVAAQAKVYLVDSKLENADPAFVTKGFERKSNESIHCEHGKICQFSKKAFLSPSKSFNPANIPEPLPKIAAESDLEKLSKEDICNKVVAPLHPGSMLNKHNLDIYSGNGAKGSENNTLAFVFNESYKSEKTEVLATTGKLMDSPKYSSAIILPSKKSGKTRGEDISSVVCKAGAFQKFSNLIQPEKNNLPLPYSYQCLFEMFKCVDLVCAMFFNRKELITFKKLKAIVQKVLRKNFNESHLSQIKHLYPEAYHFSQAKMRNFGSTSKHDYYQLVISPDFNDITIPEHANEEGINSLSQLLINRQQTFHFRLLKKVKDIHANFLTSLNPKLNITEKCIVRWHPEFTLENCPEVEKADLPQSPDIEKYSSAKDVLSTARNLFHQDAFKTFPIEDSVVKQSSTFEKISVQGEQANKNLLNYQSADILKNVPASLVEKIREKKMATTVEPHESQNTESIKFRRIPTLLSQLRNIFITEKKNILPLDTVIKKVIYCYQMTMTTHDVELNLKFIAQKSGGWLSLHEMRRKYFLKMDRTIELKEILNKLRP